MQRTIAVTGLLCIVLSRQAFAEPLSDQAKHVAQVALKGMKENLDKIRSGRFEAIGREKKHRDDPPSIEGQIRLSGAFDFDRALFRFDSEDPELHSLEVVESLGLEVLAAPKDQPMDNGRPPQALYVQKTRFVRTPDFTLNWSNWNTDQIFRLGPNEKPSLPTWFIDFRCFGIITEVSFSHGLDFDGLFARLESQEVIEAVDESNGLYRLVWAFGKDGAIKRTAWFDSQRGFTVVRMELREGTLDGKPIAVNETEWQEVASVWVPKSVSIRQTPPNHYELDLSFKWKSVNEPVAEGIFDLGGDLIDLTTGKPKRIKRSK